MKKFLKFMKWASPFILTLSALYAKDVLDEDVLKEKRVENSLKVLTSDIEDEALINWAYESLERSSDEVATF